MSIFAGQANGVYSLPFGPSKLNELRKITQCYQCLTFHPLLCPGIPMYKFEIKSYEYIFVLHIFCFFFFSFLFLFLLFFFHIKCYVFISAANYVAQFHPFTSSHGPSSLLWLTWLTVSAHYFQNCPTFFGLKRPSGTWEKSWRCPEETIKMLHQCKPLGTIDHQHP